MEVEKNEIHIFNGGETRRRQVEHHYKTKVSLCSNPVNKPIIFEEAKKWMEE